VRQRPTITALIAIFLTVFTTGCTAIGEVPVPNLTETAGTTYTTTPSGQPVTAIAEVLDRNRDRLLGIDGVQGVGIGLDSAGHEVVVVYVRDSATIQRLPAQIDGYTVHAEVTGPVSPTCKYRSTTQLGMAVDPCRETLRRVEETTKSKSAKSRRSASTAQNSEL
jgi:hypothetical protein